MTDQESIKRNRTQVVIMIVALPLMVLFGAYSLIFLAQQEELRDTTNFGEFVDPPLLAGELGLTDAAGQPVDGRAFWWVWVVASECAAPCRQALDGLAQLRELLAENAAKTQLALVPQGAGGVAGQRGRSRAPAIQKRWRSDARRWRLPRGPGRQRPSALRPHGGRGACGGGSAEAAEAGVAAQRSRRLTLENLVEVVAEMMKAPHFG